MIELIVTLLIAGILSALATVSYKAYLTKSRLAEAAVIMRTLSTAETTFYLTHKYFQPFAVPFSDSIFVDCLNNLNCRIAPTNGQKYAVNSAISRPDNMRDTPKRWQRLGSPLADGNQIGYLVQGSAGKNDGAGTPLSTPPSFDSVLAVFDAEPEEGSGPRIRKPDGAYSACLPVDDPNTPDATFDLFYSFSKKAKNQPDKSWMVIVAIANFDNSADDTMRANQFFGVCSFVYQFIETNSAGKVVINPMITQNFGH